MGKLILENFGWEESRTNLVYNKLNEIINKIDQAIKLKNNIIVYLQKNDRTNEMSRAEYDGGVIILYESTPDFMGDFIHELGHQFFRYDKLDIISKLKLENIFNKLKNEDGDGRIFIQKHTYSNEKEVLATLFKWYILGKVSNIGYLEVLNNYQPEGVKLIERLLRKDSIEKSEKRIYFKTNKNLLLKSLTFSGHKLQGRTKFQGVDISIENRKGSYREGTDNNGKKWKTYMKYPYGYIRGTVGKDKDHLDCYIGPNKNSEVVFVVHQNDPETSKYDEDKVMLGFDSGKQAKKAYLGQYDSPKFFGTMTTMSIDEFKEKIFSKQFKGTMVKSLDGGFIEEIDYDWGCDKDGLLKSRKLPIGSTRTWGGKTYRKVGDGVWREIGEKKEKININELNKNSNDYFYHITSKDSIKKITSEGIKESKTGQLGKGVYLANTPNDTLGYKFSNFEEGIMIRVNKKELKNRYKNSLEEWKDQIILKEKKIHPYFIEIFKKNKWDKLMKSNAIYSEELQKSKDFPVGTIRTWKGKKMQKVSKDKWVPYTTKKLVLRKEENKDLIEEIPIKNLNKGIDFKANERFLNDEIKSIFNKEDLLKKQNENNKAIEKIMKKIALYNNKELSQKIIQEITILQKEVDNLFDIRDNLENEISLANELKKINIKKIESFAKNLTPVHSLSTDKFLKVLESGGLKSLDQLEESGRNSVYAYIESEIRPKYGNKIAELLYEDRKKSDGGIIPVTFELLKKELGEEEYKKSFQNILGKIVDLALEDKKGAIGYEVDKELGTNKHVFSIIGPNGNGSGYGEISIILKQDIMRHPDFNMTPVAGTSFYSGEMYDHREWSEKSSTRLEDSSVLDKFVGKTIIRKDNGEAFELMEIQRETDKTVAIVKVLEKKTKKSVTYHARSLHRIFENMPNTIEGIDEKTHFNKSKLNAKENQKYYEYMAKDIAAQGSIDDYLERQSHGKWEGHLPAFVPTSMFAEVVMKKDIYFKIENRYILSTELGTATKEELDRIVEKYKGKGGDFLRSMEYKILSNRIKKKLNITLVNESSDILPYMNKGFKEGKWRNKK